MAADHDKVKAMVEWQTLQNIQELWGFLGLTGYYRKFVVGYACIAFPLIEKLKKGKFGWSFEAKQAFLELKQAMAKVPMLAMPDFSKPFIIKTNASRFGLAAVLLQDQCPIAFYCHTLGTQARLKSIYEKELVTIVFAMAKWCPYLLGRPFVCELTNKV